MTASIINLNQSWRFSKQANGIPDALPADWEPVSLPHTWNAVDGQDGGNDYHRGTCYYARSLNRCDLPPADQYYLELRGANSSADVWLNGQKLAHHDGGYSAWRVDLTDAMEDENLLVVAVDNASNDHVYPQMADFTFYGGLYRDVLLHCVPESHFDLDYFGGSGLMVTPAVSGKDADVEVEVFVSNRKPGQSLRYAILDGETVVARLQTDETRVRFHLDGVHLWHGRKDPHLYTARVELMENGECLDRVSARFGCRSFEIDPERGFILNGEEYPLRGVSRHQDRKGVGNALLPEHHLEDMDLICEVGANTIRLAHYQHDQYFYDLCDERGMVVWAEIPYISSHLPGGRENTLSQMRELIIQNYNHPSIVVWGLSNEITASGPVSEDLLDNHRALNDLCHAMDKTRPTTMAHVFMLEQESELIPIADIGSYNLYFGWYLGELEQNDTFFDEYHRKYPNRVIGFSEYGADANPQYQSAHPEKGDYSESYQCVYHEHIMKCIEARPYLWATHVWNLFDFAADGRDEGGKHGENQKGLVTFDRKLRKDAFYLYKAYWSKEPFVHLCGRRYADRTEEVTEIKVYSNRSEVTLLVDGKEVASGKGAKIYTFQVPITGEHTVEVRSGSLSDCITIRKAEKANPDYRMAGGEVVNWFDADKHDPTCFSIKDTLGTLMRHPKAGAIVGRMMQNARASRGDVAQAAAGNANLERMMAGMTLQSLLKQAGPAIKPEQIHALNAALQQIKK